MNRQDWYLNKLGISQYVLRKPNVIQGEAKVEITNNMLLASIIRKKKYFRIF
jgi:DNA polymerase III, psi subunit